MKDNAQAHKKNTTLVTKVKKLGVSGLKPFVKVFALFSLANLACIILALAKLDSKWAVLYVFIIGLILTGLALYLTYKHVLKLGMLQVYHYAQPYLQGSFNIIADKLLSAKSKNTPLATTSLVADFEKGLVVQTKKLVPKSAHWLLRVVVKKIPFASIISSISEELNGENSEEQKALAYSKFDSYMKDQVLNTSLNAVYMVLFISIAAQLGVLVYFLTR